MVQIKYEQEERKNLKNMVSQALELGKSNHIQIMATEALFLWWLKRPMEYSSDGLFPKLVAQKADNLWLDRPRKIPAR